MSRDRLIAQRILVRDMPDRSRIVATLRIDQIGGNAHPHFSATGEVFAPHGNWSGAAQARNGREADCGGCVHAEILRAFPGAAPFVAMHLSDYPSGRPMHALENSWYFYSGGHLSYELKNYGAEYVARHGTTLERAARTLRCSVAQLPLDASRWEFAQFVAAQEFRWAREARKARELLERMPDLYALRGYDGAGKPCDREPLRPWLIGGRTSDMVSV